MAEGEQEPQQAAPVPPQSTVQTPAAIITRLLLDRTTEGDDAGTLINGNAWDQIIIPNRTQAGMNQDQIKTSIYDPITSYVDADTNGSPTAGSAATQQLTPVIGAALQDPTTRQNLLAALQQNYAEDPQTLDLINKVFTVADRPLTMVKIVQNGDNAVEIQAPNAAETQRATVAAATPIPMVTAPVVDPTAQPDAGAQPGAEEGTADAGDEGEPGLSSGEALAATIGVTALTGFGAYRMIKRSAMKRATIKNIAARNLEAAMKERGYTEAPETAAAPKKTMWERLFGSKEEVKPATPVVEPNAGAPDERAPNARSEAEQAARDAHAKTLRELRAARNAARAPATGAPVNNISININNGNTTPAATVETGPVIVGPDGKTPARSYQSFGSGSRTTTPPVEHPPVVPAESHTATPAQKPAVTPRTQNAGTGTSGQGTSSTKPTTNPTPNARQSTAPLADIHTTLPAPPPVEPVSWFGRIKAGFENVKTYVRGTSELKLPSNRVGSLSTKIGAVGLAATGVTIVDDIQRGNTGAAVRDAAVAGVGIALVKKIPVVGAPLGMLSAGSDAVEDFKKGNNARGWLDVAEAGLYTTAAVTGTAAAFNFWNPAGWGAGAIALTTGTAAGAITVGKQLYRSKDTIAGWFGYGPKADKPAPINNGAVKPAEHPHALQPTNGFDETKKFSWRGAALGALPGIVTLNPVLAVAGAVAVGGAGAAYGHHQDTKIAAAAQKPAAALVGGQGPGGTPPTGVAGIGARKPGGAQPDGKEVLPGQAAGAEEPEGPLEKMIKMLMKLLVMILGEKNAKAMGINVDELKASSAAAGKPVAGATGGATGPAVTAGATPAAAGSLAEAQAFAGILAKPGHEAQNQQLEAIMTNGYKRTKDSKVEDAYLRFRDLSKLAKAGDAAATRKMPEELLALMQKDPDLAKDLNQSLIPGLRREYLAQFATKGATPPVVAAAGATAPAVEGQASGKVTSVAPGALPQDAGAVRLPPSTEIRGATLGAGDTSLPQQNSRSHVSYVQRDQGGAHVYTPGEWLSKTWREMRTPPNATQISQMPPGMARDALTLAAIHDGRMATVDPNAAGGLNQRGGYRSGLPLRTFDGQQAATSTSTTVGGNVVVTQQTGRAQVISADI